MRLLKSRRDSAHSSARSQSGSQWSSSRTASGRDAVDEGSMSPSSASLFSLHRSPPRSKTSKLKAYYVGSNTMPGSECYVDAASGSLRVSDTALKIVNAGATLEFPLAELSLIKSSCTYIQGKINAQHSDELLELIGPCHSSAQQTAAEMHVALVGLKDPRQMAEFLSERRHALNAKRV